MTLKPGLEEKMWTSEIKEEFSLTLSALQKWALSFLSPQCPSTPKSGGNSWNGNKLMDVPLPRVEEGHSSLTPGHSVQFSSVQLLSHVRLFATP